MKKMIRKMLVTTVTGLLALSLVGCGKDDADAQAKPEEATDAVEKFRKKQQSNPPKRCRKQRMPRKSLRTQLHLSRNSGPATGSVICGLIQQMAVFPNGQTVIGMQWLQSMWTKPAMPICSSGMRA